MAGQRQPIELVMAKGKKHLTKAEIEERKKTELKVDLKNVKAPSYLPKKLKIEFEEISKKLLEIGIMTELDEIVSHVTFFQNKNIYNTQKC